MNISNLRLSHHISLSILLVATSIAHAETLVNQTWLPGVLIPHFVTPLPVFGPAGSIPRVDAARHRRLTVTMKEIDQQVLPENVVIPTTGTLVTPGKTRVWTYEISDSDTNEILGPAHWPAVTIDARRGAPVQVTYVNQLPSFNPADPTGPGLVQGLLYQDQTLHWADPLDTGCHSLNCESPENATSPCCRPYIGPQPVTVHLHGAEIPACFDGGPDSWFTPNGITGPEFCSLGNPPPGSAIYNYQNSQEAGTLWLHDHTLGVTRNNVYAGLAGFYFLRDPKREPKKLPSGPYEIELAIQDRFFDTNGQLLSPHFLSATSPQFHPYWVVRELGDVMTVNGAAWPYLDVEPRRYRFRVLDGANGRRLDLHFGGAPVYQIGADDNYFDVPVHVNNTACADSPSSALCSDVSLMPGERADIIVDFSQLFGQTITLLNHGSLDTPLLEVMQFRVVVPLQSPDESCDPADPNRTRGICARPRPVVKLTDGNGNLAPGVRIDKVRQLVLGEMSEGDILEGDQEIEEFINNSLYDGLECPSLAAEFPADGISESPRQGSTELWEIINPEAVEAAYHPMHVHLVQFQILNRQSFDVDGFEEAYENAFGTGPVVLPSPCVPGEICHKYGPPLPYNTPNADGALGGNPALGPFLTGDPIPPDPGESGWKDTAKSFPGQVLRLVVRIAPTSTKVRNKSMAGRNRFPFDPTEGNYVWHCHVLGHEDNEMMRPLKIEK